MEARMSGYLGSYQHQIDEKGRLSLPAPFRRDATDEPMVLVRAFPEALSLFPQATWAGVAEGLRDVQRRNPRMRTAVLAITAQAVEVTPDRQGRILVPRALQEAVGIDGQVLVIGNLDRIELWDPARFGSVAAETVPDADQLIQQVFG
jgi:MraZ protein